MVLLQEVKKEASVIKESLAEINAKSKQMANVINFGDLVTVERLIGNLNVVVDICVKGSNAVKTLNKRVSTPGSLEQQRPPSMKCQPPQRVQEDAFSAPLAADVKTDEDDWENVT